MGKPEGKRLRWKDNIKMNFGKIGWVNGQDLSGSGEEQERALANAAMNLRFHKMRGIS